MSKYRMQDAHDGRWYVYSVEDADGITKENLIGAVEARRGGGYVALVALHSDPYPSHRQMMALDTNERGDCKTPEATARVLITALRRMPLP